MYRRRASPLHAPRAGAGCAYCLALTIAALVLTAPVAMGALTLAVMFAGIAAGVGRELRRALVFAVSLGLLVAVVNALVTRDGLTVIWRLGDLPLLGHTDITLEATAYGGLVKVDDLIARQIRETPDYGAELQSAKQRGGGVG